jgi:hypothetical protein
MEPVTRLVGGDFNSPGTCEEIEVVCDDGRATEARRKWLREAGFVCNVRDVGLVYNAWVRAWSEISSFPGITRERREMESVEYLNPYGNGTGSPR